MLERFHLPVNDNSVVLQIIRVKNYKPETDSITKNFEFIKNKNKYFLSYFHEQSFGKLDTKIYRYTD